MTYVVNATWIDICGPFDDEADVLYTIVPPYLLQCSLQQNRCLQDCLQAYRATDPSILTPDETRRCRRGALEHFSPWKACMNTGP